MSLESPSQKVCYQDKKKNFMWSLKPRFVKNLLVFEELPSKYYLHIQCNEHYIGTFI